MLSKTTADRYLNWSPNVYQVTMHSQAHQQGAKNQQQSTQKEQIKNNVKTIVETPGRGVYNSIYGQALKSYNFQNFFRKLRYENRYERYSYEL